MFLLLLQHRGWRSVIKCQMGLPVHTFCPLSIQSELQFPPLKASVHEKAEVLGVCQQTIRASAGVRVP